MLTTCRGAPLSSDLHEQRPTLPSNMLALMTELEKHGPAFSDKMLMLIMGELAAPAARSCGVVASVYHTASTMAAAAATEAAEAAGQDGQLLQQQWAAGVHIGLLSFDLQAVLAHGAPLLASGGQVCSRNSSKQSPAFAFVTRPRRLAGV